MLPNFSDFCEILKDEHVNFQKWGSEMINIPLSNKKKFVCTYYKTIKCDLKITDDSGEFTLLSINSEGNSAESFAYEFLMILQGCFLSVDA